jgi:hypothetical protein
MSHPNAFNAAYAIASLVAKTRVKVDYAELYPDSCANFQEIRLILNSIAEEAQYIMQETRPPKIEPVPTPEQIMERHRRKLPDEEAQGA